MGLFDKFFGKKDDGDDSSKPNSVQLKKTAEMLDEDLYWKIIAKSLAKTDNQEDQEQFLIKEIGTLTPMQMIGFRLRTDKLLYDTFTSEMWCAAYIMNGGCSDDGFEYFRHWLISRGKKVFYAAKENPDSLVDLAEAGEDEYEFESFWYVADSAFQQKTGKDLSEYIDHDNFIAKERREMEFTWEEDDPVSMKKICPRLFNRMANY